NDFKRLCTVWLRQRKCLWRTFLCLLAKDRRVTPGHSYLPQPRPNFFRMFRRNSPDSPLYSLPPFLHVRLYSRGSVFICSQCSGWDLRLHVTQCHGECGICFPFDNAKTSRKFSQWRKWSRLHSERIRVRIQQGATDLICESLWKLKVKGCRFRKGTLKDH